MLTRVLFLWEHTMPDTGILRAIEDDYVGVYDSLDTLLAFHPGIRWHDYQGDGQRYEGECVRPAPHDVQRFSAYWMTIHTFDKAPYVAAMAAVKAEAEPC